CIGIPCIGVGKLPYTCFIYRAPSVTITVLTYSPFFPFEFRPIKNGQHIKTWAIELFMFILDSKLLKERTFMMANPTIESLIKEVNPTAIYWNTNYEPDINQQEQLLIRLCDEYGITARQFEGFLLKEPSSIKKQTQK
ncbi:deoxyribodipyrimidine photo-lyase, partial [Priestia flexa]|uniref:deoxyribodipyrimidine photo-lyase n=2 Tax=Priestia flexa TaxID=86664 RepID=UPI002E22AC47|nr:deoxyribodipyrimidine photo-lyase [Priestia flexa]